MNITVISVGKLKEKYLKLGIEEFSKRLSKYCKLDMIELDDEKCPENLSDKDMEIVKNKEGHIFLDKTGKANGRGAYICNCSECLRKAIKTNALSRAFKIEIPEDIYESLIKEIEDNE